MYNLFRLGLILFLSTLSLRRATACIMIITICTVLFLSTLSLRRATLKLIVRQNGLLPDFYPRSPCGERPIVLLIQPIWRPISIHALLAESDSRPNRLKSRRKISIHALLAESDLAGPSGPAFLFNFYPRSPCGERHLDAG